MENSLKIKNTATLDCGCKSNILKINVQTLAHVWMEPAFNKCKLDLCLLYLIGFEDSNDNFLRIII